MLIIVALFFTSFSAYGLYYFNELEGKVERNSEIAQLVIDEGYRSCAYHDKLGFKTIGIGHLITAKDNFKADSKGRICITAGQAVQLLRADYDYATQSVDSNYVWATGEVRLVLINMTFQMGETGVRRFKKAIQHLKSEDYDLAAQELLDSQWAVQTPSRASRLAGRIMGI